MHMAATQTRWRFPYLLNFSMSRSASSMSLLSSSSTGLGINTSSGKQNTLNRTCLWFLFQVNSVLVVFKTTQDPHPACRSNAILWHFQCLMTAAWSITNTMKTDLCLFYTTLSVAMYTAISCDSNTLSWLVCSMSPWQRASQRWICQGSSPCCHTEIQVLDQIYNLLQSFWQLTNTP